MYISLYVYVCICLDRNCAEEWIVRRYTVFVSTWLQLSSPARRTKAPCMCILLVAPHNLPLVQRQFLPSPMKKTIYHLLPSLQKPMSHRVGNPCLRTTETTTIIKNQQRLILMIITHSPHCDENFWFLMNISYYKYYIYYF